MLHLRWTVTVVDASQISRRPHALRLENTVEIYTLGPLGTPGITDRISFTLMLHAPDKSAAGTAILPTNQIRPAFKIGTIHAPAVTRDTAFVDTAIAILAAGHITNAQLHIAHLAGQTIRIPAIALRRPFVIGAG